MRWRGEERRNEVEREDEERIMNDSNSSLFVCVLLRYNKIIRRQHVITISTYAVHLVNYNQHIGFWLSDCSSFYVFSE